MWFLNPEIGHPNDNDVLCYIIMWFLNLKISHPKGSDVGCYKTFDLSLLNVNLFSNKMIKTIKELIYSYWKKQSDLWYQNVNNIGMQRCCY